MACKRFEGKVALVTGGASGIGAACVERFAQEGAKVVVADFSPNGQNFVDELKNKGYEALFVKMNVVEEADVENAFTSAVNAFGKVDIAVANAGIGQQMPTVDLPYEEWKKIIDINLSGVFLTDKHAAKQMLKQGGGVIVNMGSIHSHVARADIAGYSAAKGGVKLLTQSMCVSYAKDNIRINAVCPGYIRTPLLEGLDEQVFQYLASLHPQGRLGTPKEVADAVMFLSSDESTFVNGSCLMVDGGYTAQ